MKWMDHEWHRDSIGVWVQCLRTALILHESLLAKLLREVILSLHIHIHTRV